MIALALLIQASFCVIRPIFFDGSAQFPETKLYEFTEPFNLSIPKQSFVMIQSAGMASAYIYTAETKIEFKGELTYDFREFFYSGQTDCFVLVPTDCHISIAVTYSPSDRDFYFVGESKCKRRNSELSKEPTLFEAEVTQNIRDSNTYLSKTSQLEQNNQNKFNDIISKSGFQSLILHLTPNEIITIPFVSQYQTFIVRSSQRLIGMTGVMEDDQFKMTSYMNFSNFVINDIQYRRQERRVFALKNPSNKKVDVAIMLIEYIGRSCEKIHEREPKISVRERAKNMYLFESNKYATEIGSFEDIREKVRKQQNVKTFPAKIMSYNEKEQKQREMQMETKNVAKLFKNEEDNSQSWNPVDEIEEEENEVQPKGLIEWSVSSEVSGTVYRRPIKQTTVEVMPHLHNRMKTDNCGMLFFPNNVQRPDSLIVESGKHRIQTITNQSIGVNLGLNKPTVYVQTTRSSFSYYCAKMTLDERMFALKDQNRPSINQLRMSLDIKDEIAKHYRKKELHYSNLSLFEEFKVVLPRGSRYFFIDEPFTRIYFGDTRGFNISLFKVLDRDGTTKVIRLCRHYHEGQSMTGFNFGPHKAVIRIAKNEDYGQDDISFVSTTNFADKDIYNIRMSDVYLATENAEAIKFYTDISRKKRSQGN